MSLLRTFLESKELKRCIVERSFDHNIPLRYVCREAGVTENEFLKSYINVNGVSRMEITEDQIKRVLSVLGINVRYQFVIDTTIDMNQVSKNLSSKNELKK